MGTLPGELPERRSSGDEQLEPRREQPPGPADRQQDRGVGSAQGASKPQSRSVAPGRGNDAARRPGDPVAAGELLRGFLVDLRKQGGRRSLTQALLESLGREQAAHCHVAGFRNGRLVVEVDSAPLFAELSGFRREELRQAINQRLPVPKVVQLTFRMGGTGHV